MDRLIFKNITELGDFMYESAYKQSATISSVLFYDKMIKLFRWLITYEDITIGNINIENKNYSGYNREFYVTLDSNLVLDITPVYQSKISKTSVDYRDIKTDLILYDGDVNSRIAIQNKCMKKFEIVFE